MPWRGTLTHSLVGQSAQAASIRGLIEKGAAAGKVPAGKPITTTVTVKNTGAAAAAFFADPRKNTLVDYDLVTQLGGDVVGCAFVVELGFLAGRERLSDFPVHSLVRYDSE